MSRRFLVLTTILAWVAIAALVANPVSSTMLRILLLLAIAGAWLGTLLVLWKRKVVRIAWIGLSILMVLPFLLPGRAIEAEEVRARYLQELMRLEGARYFWGGECPWGIDCSGLARYSLRKALLDYGIQNLNGRATRLFLKHWWFDASAQALGEGYRNYTQPLETTGTIAEMSYAELRPGDLAVTTSGVHILVYLGEDKWIQADPGPLKVTVLHGREDSNAWFTQPMTTHRWTIFQ